MTGFSSPRSRWFSCAVVFERVTARSFSCPPGPCACIGHFYIRIDTHISTCAQAHVRTVGTARPRHPRHFPPLLCAAMHAVPLVPAAVPLAGARKNKKQRRKPEHRDEEKGRRLPPASEVLSPRAQRARLLHASDCPRGNRQSSWDADGLSPRTHPRPPPPVLPSMTWMYGLRRRARLTQRGGAVSRRSEKGNQRSRAPFHPVNDHRYSMPPCKYAHISNRHIHTHTHTSGSSAQALPPRWLVSGQTDPRSRLSNSVPRGGLGFRS